MLSNGLDLFLLDNQGLQSLGLFRFGGRYALIGYAMPLFYDRLRCDLAIRFGGFPDLIELARVKAALELPFGGPFLDSAA